MASLRVVSQTAAGRPQPPFRATAKPVRFVTGFYHEEWGDVDRFRWMKREATLELDAEDRARYLELWVFSEFHDLSQTVLLDAGHEPRELPLVRGWERISVPVPAGTPRVTLHANKLFPAAHYPGDTRQLAIRVRRPLVHADEERHQHVVRQHANAVSNTRELLAGAERLESTPPHLGIDMYGVCNVKPPCVYCEWDYSKELEGENVDAPFNLGTLGEYGEFFDNSHNLINCSIGEPFMMKELDDLFDRFGDTGKVLEMTTNGQILTDRNIERLLGRDIDLYISLDAGTPETYAKLRNDRWDDILENLRRLIAAKGGRDGLPRIHLVFMPMRINVHELEDFVKLCAELEVDRLVLRPLNYSDSIHMVWERDGYTFDYQNELLPFDELVRVSARAARLCARYGVRLADQMDFGGAMAELFEEPFDDGVVHEAAGEAVVTQGMTSTPMTPPAPPTDEPVQATEVQDQAPRAAGSLAVDDRIEVAPSEEPEPSLGGEKLPACLEPWTSLYILRRGVLPCCYGGQPIGPMNSYREAWNSEILQGIRRQLAAGRFHKYCLDSPSCPIVRKSQHAHTLPAGQAVFLRAREAFHRVDRTFFGVPGRIYRPIRAVYRFGRKLLGGPGT